MGTRSWRPVYARHLAFAEVKIELPPPIPCKREGPPKHSEGKQPRVESQATANSATSGRTTERLDEDRGPEAPEAPEREQNPPVGEAAHRVSPPPVPPPRSPKEAGPEQAPTPTVPFVGNKIGNGVTWRLFGYVTVAVSVFSSSSLYCPASGLHHERRRATPLRLHWLKASVRSMLPSPDLMVNPHPIEKCILLDFLENQCGHPSNRRISSSIGILKPMSRVSASCFWGRLMAMRTRRECRAGARMH